MTSMPNEDEYDPFAEVKFLYKHHKDLYGDVYANSLEYKVNGEVWLPNAGESQ